MNRPLIRASLTVLLLVLIIAGPASASQSGQLALADAPQSAVEAACSVTAAQEQDTPFTVTETPCPVRTALPEIEGQTVICGTITVPENYEKPNGRQVDLAFAVLKSDSLSPAPDPVIYLHGGPGAAELRDLAKMSERFAPIRYTRDVILFDQRGTGYSNGPLACDVEYATQQDAIREYIREYARGSIDEEAALNKAMFQVCLERFKETGTDLSQYNTVHNARDVVSVASALGYDTVNLYGFSYGTQVALEVMRRHPDRLRSVILDSVAPADVKLYENMGQPNVEAITSLLDLCAADEACGAAYPDLRKRFEALLVQLDKQPLTRDDGTSVTAATLVGALRQSDIRPGLGAYIPLMIWELEQGKQDTLNAILNNQVPPLPPADFDPVSIRYAGLDPAPDAQLLIDSGLSLRQKARELDAMAERLLLRADEDITLQNVGSLRAGRFDLLFHEIMNAQPFDRRLALNQAYLAFPITGDGPTVESLKAFIADHFDGSDAEALTALAGEMSEADVQALAQIIFGKARDYATFFNVSLALSLYVCQEHVPYNKVEGALRSFQALEIPEVARGKWGTVANLLATCDLFPTGLEPAGFHKPVVSDIPALILLGTADTQTATSWGEHAAESLENSQVVHFPETGHGAIRYSQCARDVGAAFLNDPEGKANTACTDDLIPLFVLPPQENERSAASRAP